MYNVTLNNRDAIFDSADGFDTVAAALAWASGRGGKYVVQIDNGGTGMDYDFLAIAADCTNGDTRFFRYLPGGWYPISPEQIAALI